MVVTRSPDNRWLKRYRLFFVVGTAILAFQVYLAVHFFALYSESVPAETAWNPYRRGVVVEDSDASANSARRQLGAVDDEDAHHRPKVKRTKVSQLRLEELDFVPSCEITTKEAVSAIHRAKTQHCKQEIANVMCLMQRGMLYPTALPNYCPNDGLERGRSLGCFKDEKNYRLLSGYYGNNKDDNSPEYCIRLCLQSGFPYAGVQYSSECFCGNDEPPSTAKLPDSSCNMKCPADPHLACGGYFTINIYQTGIKKFYPQIATTSTTNAQPVKIVFLLTLNGRALRQVKRLIKVLYHRDHYFYIHVDVRQDYLFRELLHLEKRFANVRLMRHRHATIWGGASLLKMLLSAMQDLLHLDWRWDFVLNLSESDYPVKTVDRLVEFLSANRDRNFVKSHGREVQRFIQKQGLDKTFVECDTHMWRTGDRKLPWGIQIDGGSDWVALSRSFVSYVANEKRDDLVEGLLVFFQYTLLPAESFFHTALRNSLFCGTYVDNNLHVTNWKRKLGCKCQYKHVVDWCGCSPNDFKPDDWLRIQNTESRQLYFARKFEPVVNQAVILQLEQWLFGRNLRHVPNVNSYWHNIYSHFDLTLTDDALLTLSYSAMRVKAKTLNECSMSVGKLLEVHSYHVNDTYAGNLVLFEANVSTNKVTVETILKPKTTLLLTKSSGLVYRIKMMTVSSDYDQKEQMSRNFARALGPYSEPVLIYILSASEGTTKSSNMTLLWVDPSGRLADISEMSVDDSYMAGHIRPNLRQPLLPGSWTVKVIHNSAAVIEVKFLVTPLAFLSGNPISHNQVNFVHAGSEMYREFDPSWDTYLPSPYERDSLEQLSVSNSKRFGRDLDEWIDSLLVKFYTVGATCGDFCALPRCLDSNWSSSAPDPKSHIGALNETSGAFDIW